MSKHFKNLTARKDGQLLTNPKQTNVETNYERIGCLVIGIGTIIFWSLIIWLV